MVCRPLTVLWPTLPYVPRSAGRKAEALIQLLAVWWLGYTALGLTRLGGWKFGFTVDNARSEPEKTENNWADVMDTIGASCQLLASIWSVEFENFGVVATMPKPNNCRRSFPEQLPRYCLRLPGMETPGSLGLSA